MNTLVVFAHPVPGTYPFAVKDALCEEMARHGARIDCLDQHAEGFDPRFTPADHAHFWGGAKPADIAAQHERLDRAERLAFVYPVYWWGMPAIMKGWIERVFAGDYAYRYGSGVADRCTAGLKGLLRDRPTILLGIGGSIERTYERYGYGEAMRTAIDVGLFSYCGIRDVESHTLFDVEGEANAARRAAYLDEVRAIAAAFMAPDRPARDAKREHFGAALREEREPR